MINFTSNFKIFIALIILVILIFVKYQIPDLDSRSVALSSSSQEIYQGEKIVNFFLIIKNYFYIITYSEENETTSKIAPINVTQVSSKYILKLEKKSNENVTNSTRMYTTSKELTTFDETKKVPTELLENDSPPNNSDNDMTSYLNMEAIEKGLSFNPKSQAIVFLHIQKTSGKDFDSAVVKTLLVKKEKSNGTWTRACHEGSKTFYDCYYGSNKWDWYLSRATNGWPCGVHPTFTQIKNCYHRIFTKYDYSDIHVITVLRNPVNRFLSEWRHLWRVGEWTDNVNIAHSNEDFLICIYFQQICDDFSQKNFYHAFCKN
jgi:hypothetical protein